MKLYAYNQGSASAKALAQALGIKRIKQEGRPLRLRDTLINWGNSVFKREVTARTVLNRPDAVKTAVNKLSCFKTLKDIVPMPEFTESREEAIKWVTEGFTVVARTVLTGNSGEGIVLCDAEDNPNVPAAKLYTKYVKKTDEYRIHVFRGEVFHMQKKMRKREVPDENVNWQIRNLAGGFIFAHLDIVVPEEAKQIAVAALAHIGLDFGAVDIIYNSRQNKCYLLEINTACGLEGTTLEKYVEKFGTFR